MCSCCNSIYCNPRDRYLENWKKENSLRNLSEDAKKWQNVKFTLDIIIVKSLSVSYDTTSYLNITPGDPDNNIQLLTLPIYTSPETSYNATVITPSSATTRINIKLVQNKTFEC